jgi:hypothetical protein
MLKNKLNKEKPIQNSKPKPKTFMFETFRKYGRTAIGPCEDIQIIILGTIKIFPAKAISLLIFQLTIDGTTY